MTKLHGLKDTVLISGRVTTISDEIKRGADVRTQVLHGRTPAGLRPERYAVVICNGNQADEFEISAADFRQLRAMGILTEAERVPATAAGH